MVRQRGQEGLVATAHMQTTGMLAAVRSFSLASHRTCHGRCSPAWRFDSIGKVIAERRPMTRCSGLDVLGFACGHVAADSVWAVK